MTFTFFRTLLLIIAAVTTSSTCLAQINLQDSTAQVIAYWEVGDQQSYTVINRKFKIKDGDTLSASEGRYEVKVTILAATETSYTMEWRYGKVKKDDMDELTAKMTSLSEGLRVVIKTNEMGMFQEVVNWMEIRDTMRSAIAILEKELGPNPDPKLKLMLSQLEKLFTTKDAIEGTAIKELKHFFTFYGYSFRFGEVIEGDVKLPNNFGGEPFDGTLHLELTEVDQEKDLISLELINKVDQQQLEDYIYKLGKKMAEKNGDTFERKEIQGLKNVIYTNATINVANGWVKESVSRKEVKLDETLRIDEDILIAE